MTWGCRCTSKRDVPGSRDVCPLLRSRKTKVHTPQWCHQNFISYHNSEPADKFNEGDSIAEDSCLHLHHTTFQQPLKKQLAIHQKKIKKNQNDPFKKLVFPRKCSYGENHWKLKKSLTVVCARLIPPCKSEPSSMGPRMPDPWAGIRHPWVVRLTVETLLKIQLTQTS